MHMVLFQPVWHPRTMAAPQGANENPGVTAGACKLLTEAVKGGRVRAKEEGAWGSSEASNPESP